MTPAKVNLSLEITGKRIDGYHFLRSLIVFTDQGDHLHVQPAGQEEFIISGFYGALLHGQDNLVLKARDLLWQEVQKTKKYRHKKCPCLSFHLQKNLPVAAGLGGGSSNAAATLLLCNEIWQSNFSLQELAEIALSLGADVPMCLYGLAQKGAFWAENIGDHLCRLTAFPSFALLIINKGVPLSTADVFKHYTQEQGNKSLVSFEPLQQKSFYDLKALLILLKQLDNHLFSAACVLDPSIQYILDQLEEQQALLARMSGSGASCFGIYACLSDAKRALKNIKRQHPDWFYLATTIHGYSLV